MVRPQDQQTTSLATSFTAVQRTRLFEGIVAQLRDLIRAGSLVPGQRLPPERELSERFQVSRASLREAIRALEVEGLVVIRAGTGTFVSEQGFDRAVDLLAHRLLAEREVLADILELRLILEPQIAALAAQRAIEADKQRLAEILREQAEQVDRGETGAAADAAFHTAVAAATHNQALERLRAALSDVLSATRDEGLQSPERSALSLASHQAIFASINAGDAGGASEAMSRHITEVDRVLSRPEKT